jgi:tetratricopeptide (TPR) repeat protein
MSGVCLLESGDPAEAAKRFRSALKSNADTGAIHFNLGRALEASGHPQDALEEYTVAAKTKNPYPEAEIKIGSILMVTKEYQSAADRFRRALAANPDIQEAHYKLAQALRRIGEAREAQVELRQSATLTQRQSDEVMSSHLSNESLDRAKTGDLVGALQLAKKALWLNPENAIADYNFRLLLADAENFEPAVLELRKAISLAPLKSSFYVSLAKVEL